MRGIIFCMGFLAILVIFGYLHEIFTSVDPVKEKAPVANVRDAGKSVWDKLDRNFHENEVMQLIPQYAREWVAKNPHPNLDQLVEATVDFEIHITSS